MYPGVDHVNDILYLSAIQPDNRSRGPPTSRDHYDFFYPGPSCDSNIRGLLSPAHRIYPPKYKPRDIGKNQIKIHRPNELHGMHWILPTGVCPSPGPIWTRRHCFYPAVHLISFFHFSFTDFIHADRYHKSVFNEKKPWTLWTWQPSEARRRSRKRKRVMPHDHIVCAPTLPALTNYDLIHKRLQSKRLRASEFYCWFGPARMVGPLAPLLDDLPLGRQKCELLSDG